MKMRPSRTPTTPVSIAPWVFQSIGEQFLIRAAWFHAKLPVPALPHVLWDLFDVERDSAVVSVRVAKVAPE